MSDPPTSYTNETDKSGLRWSRLQHVHRKQECTLARLSSSKMNEVYVHRKTRSANGTNDGCFRGNETRKHFFVELRYSKDRFVDLTPRAVADEIMTEADEKLSILSPGLREEVIEVLDEAHQIRQEARH